MTTIFIIGLLCGAAIGMVAAVRMCKNILEEEIDDVIRMLSEMEWSLHRDIVKRVDLTDKQ